MGYCSISDIKAICNTKRSDAELTSLIDVASARVNRDIQIYMEKEIVTSINNVKLNSIDGTNKNFYTQDWPLGDYNDDFSVTIADVIVYNIVGNNESTLTVNSITSSNGKITLETAPSSGNLYITYCHLPRHYPLSSEIIKRATAYLVAFMAQSKVPAELASSYAIDRLRIMKTEDNVRIYLGEYERLINYIKYGDGMVEVGEVAGTND